MKQGQKYLSRSSRNETVSKPVPKLMPLQAHTMLSNFNDAILK